MKKNYTHMVLVLDASGSMSGIQAATIEGVNSLVAKQKADPGDFTTAVYLFSSAVKEVETFTELNTQNYYTIGSTALLDALGSAITNEGKRLAALQEHERPDKVVVVVVTDGEENASHTYTLLQIKNMVKEQQDTYKWQFVFLGANIDAFSAGASLNFATGSTLQYTPTGQSVRSAYAGLSESLTSYKAGATAAVDLSKTTA